MIHTGGTYRKREESIYMVIYLLCNPENELFKGKEPKVRDGIDKLALGMLDINAV